MKIRKLNEVYNDPYDDYDEDAELSDDYEMSDISDTGEVKQGNAFFADGEDYIWFKAVSDVYHIDFDNWQVWSAIHRLEDTYGTDDEHDELAYFVVDIDTGFIDWGPVETEREAKEFLESKYQDYLYEDDDEDVVDSLDPDDINYVGYYS